ncbi:MAG: hypothetical protein HOV83_25735, partial [Catenulispora sp.]|nr:hypothetical protein [Catenulispora sp.]
MWRRALPDLPQVGDARFSGQVPGGEQSASAEQMAGGEHSDERGPSGGEHSADAEQSGPVQVIVLSAGDRAGLDRYAAAFVDYFASGDAQDLADVAFTLQGRSALPWRLTACATDTDTVRAALQAHLDGRSHPALGFSRVEPAASATPADPETPAEAAAAWLAGRQVPWERFQDPQARRVPLPSVPWQASEPAAEPTTSPATPPPPTSSPSVSSARAWLLAEYAEVSGIPAEQLDAHVPFTQYGLSSAQIARINLRLEEELGESDRTLFFAHPDLASVAAELATRHPDHWSATPTAQVPASAKEDHDHDHRELDHRELDQDAIAVIGLAGRYPQSPDTDAFWQTLSHGRDSVTRIPAHRAREGWPVDQMWGGFLDRVDEFDPLLFQITPRDAELMDPQERLFLEVVWEMLEDAGYSRARLAQRHGGRVAVYAGAMHNEYPYFGVEQSLRGPRQDSGATLGGVANRVSFFLDLHGPSMTVDTMCSSGLTALHLAVRALRGGESEAAIVGAVNLSLHPNKFVQQHRMKLDSATNRCRSFGAGGDGFVPAEGAGAVLLKPLRRAVADGDRIHAVIRGTSVVHAGRTNGYLVPNPEAQAEMVRQALRDAGVEPGGIGYLELHGAGTALGDPVEIDGLMRVFGAAGLPVGSVPIGSVKSVIGHVEAGAGIAGLTKVILQMRHGTFAPSLHAEELNPGIAWDRIPFRVQREFAPWPAGAGPRRAGISSFGAGGTIAHAVVEEPPAQVPQRSGTGVEPKSVTGSASDSAARTGAPGAPRLIVLSGYDADRLAAVATRLAARLRQEPMPLPDVAYTLQVGREALRERLAIVVRSVDELCEELERFAAGRGSQAVLRGRVPSAGYAVGEPVADGDLNSVAQHWIGGRAVDWEAVARRDGARPRIVSLPSYPFARMKCWLPETEASQTAPLANLDPPPKLEPAQQPGSSQQPDPTQQPPEPSPDTAEVPLYERTWEPAAAPGSAASATGPLVCVFSEHSEQVARRLAERLGRPVLLVREGGDLGDGVPGYVAEGDAVALADTLLTRHPHLDGWLDLADLYRSSAERGLWRPRLAMLQRIVAARAVSGLRAVQVVSGLHVFEHSAPSLAGARVAGFVRVLNAEYRRLNASVLDTDVPAGDTDRLVEAILTEWRATDRL